MNHIEIKSYRRKEAAKYLNISLRSLDRLKNDRQIAFCKLGNVVLFLQVDLNTFLLKSRISAYGEK